jgi:D-amino-acid dehydrogenase
MRVVVVGGGVVGLCLAYDLRRAGVTVVLVEQGQCGGGASAGNAGWITPAFSAPLATPGSLRIAARSILRQDGSFVLRPGFQPALAMWCWRFARNCTEPRWQAGLRAMIELNDRTIELYEQLQKEITFDLHTDGVLIAARTRAALDEEAAMLDRVRLAGYTGPIERLDGETVADREPALDRTLAGGFFLGAERHIRPEELCASLTRALEQNGVEILEVTTVKTIGSKVVHTDAGALEADAVVVAAGSESARLVGTAGVRLQLQAAKGYSATVSPGAPRLQRPLYLLEARVACSPFADALRVAGTFELGNVKLSIDRPRVDAMSNSIRPYLPSWQPPDTFAAWAGMRPLSPDGLPFIGPAPGAPWLFVATGHGMVGVTLAPATSAALVPVILGEASAERLHAFRLNRPN